MPNFGFVRNPGSSERQQSLQHAPILDGGVLLSNEYDIEVDHRVVCLGLALRGSHSLAFRRMKAVGFFLEGIAGRPLSTAPFICSNAGPWTPGNTLQ